MALLPQEQPTTYKAPCQPPHPILFLMSLQPSVPTAAPPHFIYMIQQERSSFPTDYGRSRQSLASPSPIRPVRPSPALITSPYRWASEAKEDRPPVQYPPSVARVSGQGPPPTSTRNS